VRRQNQNKKKIFFLLADNTATAPCLLSANGNPATMQTNTVPTTVPAVLLTVLHLNEDDDDRFGGLCNFEHELWNNRHVSEACKAIFERVGVDRRSVFPFGGYSRESLTTLCLIVLPGTTPEKIDEALRDKAWVGALENRFSKGFRGHCTLSISSTCYPEESPLWKLGADYFAEPPCVHPLWKSAAFSLRPAFEDHQSMNDAILVAHGQALARRSRQDTPRTHRRQGEGHQASSVAASADDGSPSCPEPRVPRKRKQAGSGPCSSPQSRAIPTRCSSRPGRMGNESEDSSPACEPEQGENEEAAEEELRGLVPAVKQLRLSTAKDDSWPSSGYKEFRYRKPGPAKDARGRVIGEHRDEDVLTKSPLFAQPGRVLSTRMYLNRARKMGFMQGVYRSIDDLLRRITSCKEDERHFNIVVEPGYPVSFYADCEFELGEGERTDPGTAARLLQATLAVLAHCLEQCFGKIRITWEFSSATTREKYSFHLHIELLCFPSVEEHRDFMLHVKDVLESARVDGNHPLYQHAQLLFRTNKAGKLKCFIDFGVYDNFQNFRLAANSKPGKNNPLLEAWISEEGEVCTSPVPQDPSELRACILRSIIISPPEGALRLPRLPDEFRPKRKNASRASAADSDASPAVVEGILEMLRDPPTHRKTGKGWEGFKDPYFSGESNGFLTFNYHDHDQECPFGNSHARKGIFATVDPRTGKVTVGCYGTACKGKACPLGRLSPDRMPLSEEANRVARRRFGCAFPSLTAPDEMRYRNEGRELEIVAMLYGNCEMTLRKHSGVFGSALVIGSDGEGRWECRHPECAGVRGTKPLLKFLKNKADRDAVFPHLKKGTAGRDPHEIPPELLAELEALNDRFAVVRDGSRTKIADLRSYDETVKGTVVSLLEKSDFLTWKANVTVVLEEEEGDRKRTVNVAQEWLKWPGRNEYEGIVLDPSETCPATVLNLWQGFAVEAREGDCSKQLDFRRRIVCRGDEVAFQYLLNLEALMIQKPGELTGVVLILRGGQGVGKSVLAGQIGSLFGPAYKRISHQSITTNHFNAWQGGTAVVFIDEAHWAGDKTAECFLRSNITDKLMMKEPKGVDHVPMVNHAKWIIATNEYYYFPAALDDRRAVPYLFSSAVKQDTEYFAALQDDWDSRGGKEAYLHFLKNRDISRFDPLKRPEACVRELWSQKVHHMDPLENWFWHFLRDGGFWHKPEETTHVLLSELFRDYKMHFEQSRANRHGFIKNAELLWGMLKERFLPKREYKRETVATGSSSRANVYPLPPLDDLRTHFAETVALTPFDVVFSDLPEQDVTMRDAAAASGANPER